MKDLNPTVAVTLENDTCPYCGVDRRDRPFNTDHTISRRFVPKGKLKQSWNLIVQSCVRCNNQKSDLEDDLSAITMQPDGLGEFSSGDVELRLESKRKGAKSISRRTKKPVADSWETKTMRTSLGPGMDISFSLLAPPQLDLERAAALAELQLAALFYWITYDANTARGGFWLGECVAINVAFRRDWGNSLQRSFRQSTRSWDGQLDVIAADGYFKAALWRQRETACWSWALEWNHNVRLIGLFGEPTAIDEFTSRLEPFGDATMGDVKRPVVRLRKEVQLEPGADSLFERESPRGA